MPLRHQKKTIAPGVVEWSITGEADEQAFVAFMDDAHHWLRALYAAGQRTAVVIDPSGMPDIPANLRKLAGEWRRENATLIRNTIVAAAYITPSAVLRGVMTAIFWFYHPVVPAHMFATQREALTWLQRRMHEDAA